jgi:hypothetical protein
MELEKRSQNNPDIHQDKVQMTIYRVSPGVRKNKKK